MIIAEIRASNGALVRIHDDCMAPRGSEEERRAIERQRQAAHKILMAYAGRDEEAMMIERLDGGGIEGGD